MQSKSEFKQSGNTTIELGTEEICFDNECTEDKVLRLEETIDGRFIILVNGFQWGGTYDLSGVGNAVFDTEEEALKAFGSIEKLTDYDFKRSEKDARVNGI